MRGRCRENIGSLETRECRITARESVRIKVNNQKKLDRIFGNADKQGHAEIVREYGNGRTKGFENVIFLSRGCA